ncbi:MAG: VOC family protein [Planctomycetaceae bacterium]
MKHRALPENVVMYTLIEVARFTGNVPAATEFYQQLLGRTPVRQCAGLSEFELGGVTLRVHEIAAARDDGLPAEDHIAFGVDDLEQACADAQKRGLRCERPPQTYDWGRSAYLRDPDGQLVDLHEPSSGR